MLAIFCIKKELSIFWVLLFLKIKSLDKLFLISLESDKTFILFIFIFFMLAFSDWNELIKGFPLMKDFVWELFKFFLPLIIFILIDFLLDDPGVLFLFLFLFREIRLLLYLFHLNSFEINIFFELYFHLLKNVLNIELIFISLFLIILVNKTILLGNLFF